MAADVSLLLEVALRKGLLTSEEAERWRSELQSAADPVELLRERGRIGPEEVRALRNLLVQFERDREVSHKLVQDGVVSHEAADRVWSWMLESIPSGRVPSLQEAARELNLPIGVEVARREEETRRLSKFDRFQIRRELGRGGMGVVHEAHDPKLNRSVALKLLRFGARKHELERFYREATAMARLHHPGVAAVYDVGERQDQPYIVMEFISGKDLRKTLEEKRVSRREAIEVLRQAAEAVAFAHEHGVLHRDLKPENVMVTPEKRAVVMDFGLAKIQESEERTLSVVGEPMGTPSYMSPEQARGRWAEVDARTDVWGIGATLYHVLTGRPPFMGKTVSEVVRKIVETDPRPPRKLDPSVDKDLEAICLKALEKERSRRYGKMSDVAMELQRVLQGEPVQARPPGVAYQARRWLIRKKMYVGALAGVLLLSFGATWAAVSLARSRNFREAKSEAAAAHAAGNWALALAKCEEGLRIRNDAELARIADESRDRMHRARSLQALQDRLKPVEARIRDVRLLFYIPGAKVDEKLRELETILGELDRLLQDPATAAFPDGWRALGVGWVLIGDADRAETALLRGERIAPRDGWINLYLARIYLERWWTALLAAPRDFPEEQRKASKAWAEKALDHLRRPVEGWEGSRDVDRAIAQAYRDLAEGEVAAVERICTEGASKWGGEVGSEEFWILLGGVRQGPAQFDAYTRAVQRRSHDAWTHFLRGTANPDGGLKDYDAALLIHPRFVWAYYKRGLAYWEKGDRAKANADLTKAIDLDRACVPAYQMRALLRLETGDKSGALADATEAVRIDEGRSDSRFCRGRIHAELRQWKEAVEDYDAAIRIHDRFTEAFFHRAVVRMQLTRYADAIADFGRAVDLDPRHTRAWLSRGMAHLVTGQNEKAIEDCTKAIELDSKFPQAYYTRGRAHSALEDAEKAIADYGEAIRLNDRFADAYYWRGVELGSRGDEKGMRADLRRALEVAPQNWPLRSQVQTLLGETSE